MIMKRFYNKNSLISTPKRTMMSGSGGGSKKFGEEIAKKCIGAGCASTRPFMQNNTKATSTAPESTKQISSSHQEKNTNAIKPGMSVNSKIPTPQSPFIQDKVKTIPISIKKDIPMISNNIPTENNNTSFKFANPFAISTQNGLIQGFNASKKTDQMTQTQKVGTDVKETVDYSMQHNTTSFACDMYNDFVNMPTPPPIPINPL